MKGEGILKLSASLVKPLEEPRRGLGAAFNQRVARGMLLGISSLEFDFIRRRVNMTFVIGNTGVFPNNQTPR
jgi:hypothetical protein